MWFSPVVVGILGDLLSNRALSALVTLEMLVNMDLPLCLHHGFKATVQHVFK